MANSYTVIPNKIDIETDWDASGRATAVMVRRMPTKTFASLIVAKRYMQLCRSKGFTGILANDTTKRGMHF